MSSMLKKKGGLAFKPKAPAGKFDCSCSSGSPPDKPSSGYHRAGGQPKTPTAPEAIAPAATTSSYVAQTAEKEATARSQRAAAPTPLSPPATQRQPAAVAEWPVSQAAPVVVTAPATLPPTPPPTQPTVRQTRTRRSTTAAPAAAERQEESMTQRTRIAISSLLQSEEAVVATGVVPADEAASIVSPAPAVAEIVAPAAGRRGRSKAKAAASDPAPVVPTEGESAGAAVAATAPPARRRYTRRKPVGSAAAAADGQEGGAEAQVRPRASRKRSATSGTSEGPAATTVAVTVPAAAKRSRREREVTPEDAETRTVDHRELKMEDLTKDLRIGKKFSRHDELVDREREKRRQYRLGKKNGTGGTAAMAVAGSGGSSETGSVLGVVGVGSETGGVNGGQVRMSDAVAAAASVMAAAVGPRRAGGAVGASAAGPQFEIIDGNIVVNQASLVHDRHAAAAAAAGELEEVEENDFTRQTTSNTYLKPGKLRGPNAWTEAETELFYRALSMFGTSFDLICNMFPGKSRRHIKMKFNREDKLRPDRITDALVGQHKVAIDVDEYMARTGQTLHATETIDAEYAQRQAEHDAEQQRIADDAAELLRKKREDLFRPRGSAAGAGVKTAAGQTASHNLSARDFDPLGGAGSGPNPDDEIDETVEDETDLVRHNGRRRPAGRSRVGGMKAAVASGFGEAYDRIGVCVYRV
ncbi:transcription factor tfiiib [Grosmannia clavigera kw1407]|uniref:Transcription factor tfiiib n=1 Tax=Grosmannia clavigera (strain kw1407 / UAMH 11150) TaxID=655863 RepID=F0XST8_GROCL|nr:transcription factor tfiiib [Grosmannia clavigera kw1407]EFW99242.1 transcription factor tfiiib [Grosmannia clavigera kw1407]